MKKLKSLLIRSITLLIFLQITGCVHRTAMNDRSLSPLWKGQPMTDQEVLEAKENWPNEKTLINLQQGTNLLREDKLDKKTLKQAKSYFEEAYLTFEDLKDPENFSQAFTSDSKTPFRGKPFERMLSAMLLALLDADEKRCDIALPTLKAAEFLDARWQPYMYGSDAPLVYSLLLRCLGETRNSSQDYTRAKEGLIRAVRLKSLNESLLEEINDYSKQSKKTPASQIAITLLEVGIPSALLVAPTNAGLETIFDSASGQAIQFLPRVLKNKEEPYYSAVVSLVKEIDNNSEKDQTTAKAIFEVEVALKEIKEAVLKNSLFKRDISQQLQKAHQTAKIIENAAKKPAMTIYLTGQGPKLTQEGQYREVTRIVPNPYSTPATGIYQKRIKEKFNCGITNYKGDLIVTLCSKGTKNQTFHYKNALKLWSSNYQAMTTVGRKFDRILKGRAQFRMGTEIAALIGAYTALALLDAGIKTRDQNVQTAALVVGAVAGAAWLAGKATNPEADIRHVQHNFEAGYLLLH